MGDGVIQIRSKDDEDISQFCLAKNKNVIFNCSEISALPTIPEIPTFPEFKPCELTTELFTTETELTTFTTEEIGTVSVSSPQRTSTEESDPTVNALTTEGEPPPSSTVDGASLTSTVISSQQSTSNLDLLPSTTTPRNDSIPLTSKPNAALIIGLSSVGVLFLIVVVVILFYKFYYKPKKTRRLTVNPTSGGSPEEVNRALRIHDPDKKVVELYPAKFQAWDGKSETKEPHIKANDVDGKSSPPALPPVISTMKGGETDITKPKKKKKRKRKTPEANEMPNVESPVIGNGKGVPTEVIT